MTCEWQGLACAAIRDRFVKELCECHCLACAACTRRLMYGMAKKMSGAHVVRAHVCGG